MKKSLLFALALAMAAPGVSLAQGAPSQTPQVTFIHAGRLLDQPGRQPRGPATIIVRDGKVAEVRDGLVAPEPGARLVDLGDEFVLPGLADLHVHLFSLADPVKSRLEANERDREDELITAIVNARTTLRAGFTTVRDQGSPPRAIRALRDATARGDVDGPTIINAGEMISVSGGHGDNGGLNEAAYDAYHPHGYDNLCNGPDDCRRAVREQVRLGAQVIKLAATGGVLSNVAGGLAQQMTDDELKAVIDTAHAFGRKAGAHSHGSDGTMAAVRAGVDTIDHGSVLDEATIKLMKERGTWLVPTMLAPATAAEQARAGMLNANSAKKALELEAKAKQSHALAIRSGVKIAFGTDTGVSKHGDNAREFALMVGAGMTPMAAIVAATTDAATALGRTDFGRIAPGMAADIIAVKGDPLNDVTRLEHVDFVMKGGKVIGQE